MSPEKKGLFHTSLLKIEGRVNGGCPKSSVEPKLHYHSIKVRQISIENEESGPLRNNSRMSCVTKRQIQEPMQDRSQVDPHPAVDHRDVRSLVK